MSDYSLLEKYESIQHRFEEVSQQITDPSAMSDMKRYVKLNQEYKRLDALVQAFKEYKALIDNIAMGKEILDEESDPELREMARMEMESTEILLPEKEQNIKMLLVPADPEDSKNAILEIRAGTGGDEAQRDAGRVRPRVGVRGGAGAVHVCLHGADAGGDVPAGGDQPAVWNPPAAALRRGPLRGDCAGGHVYRGRAALPQLE